MPEEAKGAITSDKIETDNTNFATVRADQTCEEALVPRENAYRQLNWQVTLEKGSIYNPQEDVGIYADEVDCKYGVQIHGDVFGRSAVSLEHGGAAHSGADGEGTPVVGARIVGSVVSEGQVDVTAPGSRMDDWEPRPVQVYGDVIGDHVTVEEPTVVYGAVTAETTLRANAPLVVIGDVRSEGILEASDLFAFSVSARDDVTLGRNVAVVNPEIRTDEGSLTIADRVGILTPDLLEHIRSNNDVDAVGPWVFDVDAVWERSALVPADVSDHGSGQVASRAWRTVADPAGQREGVRQTFTSMIERTRKQPPDVEEFRYAGVGSIGGGTEITVEGDVVAGDQEKRVDESTTAVDRSTEIHDESTTVEDSVVNRSDIDGGGEED
ncbi:hypothetical protein [Haloplanus pelagicus]|jgi:hypothetical protein|uniref:hypothetical protein n=1 Tax=Haloplanus pelagicus TaxID=2949995 RepID=UPI00203D8D43|nr:hypothetical protein [Haloplanus sp. HW8-1]